jgi:hypothetical protein
VEAEIAEEVPKQAGNKRGGSSESERLSGIERDEGVRQWRDRKIANHEFLKQKREWRSELRKRKGSRSRSSSEGLISVEERIRFQGESSQAYGRRMSVLDEGHIAGADVRVTEGVRLETRTAAEAIGMEMAEHRSVNPTLTEQSRAEWFLNRMMPGLWPDRFEKKSRGYVAKVEVEEKGRRRFIVQRKWYEPGWMLCRDWCMYGWKCSCWVLWKLRSDARRS